MEKLKLNTLLGDLKEAAQLDIREDTNGQVLMGAAEEQTARDALGEELFNRITRKPFESWTIVELAELAERVDDLFREGRENEKARQLARRVMVRNYRSKLRLMRTMISLRKSASVFQP